MGPTPGSNDVRNPRPPAEADRVHSPGILYARARDDQGERLGPRRAHDRNTPPPPQGRIAAETGKAEREEADISFRGEV